MHLHAYIDKNVLCWQTDFIVKVTQVVQLCLLQIMIVPCGVTLEIVKNVFYFERF